MIRTSAAILLAATIALAGCTAAQPAEGANGTPPPAGQPTPPPAAIEGCTTSKVSANLATIEELAAAFEAAGIPSAENWAEEVEEYRPYPDDPNWAKLSKELGKYNIAPAVLAAIVSCLEA